MKKNTDCQMLFDSFYLRYSEKIDDSTDPTPKEKTQTKKIKWITLEICAEKAKLIHKKDESSS